jgi:hypothetical protein
MPWPPNLTYLNLNNVKLHLTQPQIVRSSNFRGLLIFALCSRSTKFFGRRVYMLTSLHVDELFRLTSLQVDELFWSTSLQVDELFWSTSLQVDEFTGRRTFLVNEFTGRRTFSVDEFTGRRVYRSTNFFGGRVYRSTKSRGAFSTHERCIVSQLYTTTLLWLPKNGIRTRVFCSSGRRDVVCVTRPG